MQTSASTGVNLVLKAENATHLLLQRSAAGASRAFYYHADGGFYVWLSTSDRRLVRMSYSPDTDRLLNEDCERPGSSLKLGGVDSIEYFRLDFSCASKPATASDVPGSAKALREAVHWVLVAKPFQSTSTPSHAIQCIVCIFLLHYLCVDGLEPNVSSRNVSRLCTCRVFSAIDAFSR
jgi:hypothetical protein